jgi:hypothetical protein
LVVARNTLGVEVLRWTSPSLMRSFIGAALVFFSIYSLARPKLPTVSGGPIADGAVGVISGFLGGSTGLGGIAVIVWSTLRGWSKDEQRAVFQPVAISIFAMTLIWFGGSGMVTSDTPGCLPSDCLPSCWHLARPQTLRHAQRGSISTVVLVLLLISGLTLLPSTIMSAN